MRQYSVFTHGTALAIETPENVAHYVKLGWGTQIVFKEPVGKPLFPHFFPPTPKEMAWPDFGPGSWFHLPLSNVIDTFGSSTPQLVSVTILFATSRCRIKDLHVWDGATIVEVLDLGKFGLHGEFLESRDSKDLNPDIPFVSSKTFANTITLRKPHRVFSAIGLSFFACAFHDDFKDALGDSNPPRFAPSILTVGAGGGQFVVDDRSLVTLSLRVGP